LDNIGVFDRSAPLPGGGHLEQSDGTSWMAMYSLNLLSIALELACEEPEYEDVASKFWEHFVHIARAMNTLGLWDEKDGFYYDLLHRPGEEELQLKIRSMVGLIPLFAVETVDAGRIGGNSSWRGPIWFPVNYLLVESLRKFHHYVGDSFRVECPTGSGKMLNLAEVAAELSRRLSSIFLRDERGRRPVLGREEKLQ